MNFSQLHERLRLELLRRIDRGNLSGALLARQTGFRQSHISNFLHRKRALSLAALDRILASQMLSVDDLLVLDSSLSGISRSETSSVAGANSPVPVVTHIAAIHESRPAPHSTVDVLQVPNRLIDHLRSRRAVSRRDWTRFVAVRVSAIQAAGMDPVLRPDALAVIDRHYNSLVPYLNSQPSLYAIRSGNTLLIRFADFELNRLILRPYRLAYPVRLLALGPHEVPSDLLVGRICLLLAEV